MVSRKRFPTSKLSTKYRAPVRLATSSLAPSVAITAAANAPLADFEADVYSVLGVIILMRTV